MAGEFDGRYDYTKPWDGPGQSGAPKWTYNGPWASNEERLTQQALVVATIPGVQLQKLVKAPLPQIQLFPPKYGYGDRRQPDIDDVVSVNRIYTEPRVSWYSGGVAGYTGSSRNDLGAN
jgi:hypothetical protein